MVEAHSRDETCIGAEISITVVDAVSGEAIVTALPPVAAPFKT